MASKIGKQLFNIPTKKRSPRMQSPTTLAHSKSPYAQNLRKEAHARINSGRVSPQPLKWKSPLSKNPFAFRFGDDKMRKDVAV